MSEVGEQLTLTMVMVTTSAALEANGQATTPIRTRPKKPLGSPLATQWLKAIVNDLRTIFDEPAGHGDRTTEVSVSSYRTPEAWTEPTIDCPELLILASFTGQPEDLLKAAHDLRGDSIRIPLAITQSSHGPVVTLRWEAFLELIR